MPATDRDAKIRWEDGDIPVSTRFDDPYYSRRDGLAESRHVFLAGNDLPAAWAGRDDFTIAELGFGTGLNALAALQLWSRTAPEGAHLRHVGFERFPLTGDQITRALSHWPELAPLAGSLVAQWPADRIALPGATLTIVEGDARTAVPAWQGIADAWFLDGFAPARNPEMWEPDLLKAVHDHTRPGGSFATYSAAGHVRRAFAAAGFAVAKRPGFGSKREMLAGRRD